MIGCLKKIYVKNKLAKECAIELEQVMREAANVDYRLDPLLTESCLYEIAQLCSDEPNDKKEDCLRLAFQHDKIEKKTPCYQEVQRIIAEGAADIFADHELHENCVRDLVRICYDVPPGAAQRSY